MTMRVWLVVLFAAALLSVVGCSESPDDPGASRTSEQGKMLRDRLANTQYDR